jgi:transcriptional regulator with XRE-family HTH domain
MKTPTPLRRERVRKGLTQLDLAVKADCSLNTVALAERSGRVSEEMATRFSRALGVPSTTIRPAAPAVDSESASEEP